MRKFALIISCLCLCMTILSCSKNGATTAQQEEEADADSLPLDPPLGYVIEFQPLGNFSHKEAERLREEFVKQLEKWYNNIDPRWLEASVGVNDAKPIPASCYYQPRKRYRAGSILQWLHKCNGGNPEIVTIGLTNSDISTTTRGQKDYGIMGYSYRPGDVAVISTYRLKGNKDDLLKVTLHEFLHTRGLPHCKKDNPTCLMQDAHGKNTFYRKKGPCKDCMKKLKGTSN